TPQTSLFWAPSAGLKDPRDPHVSLGGGTQRHPTDLPDPQRLPWGAPHTRRTSGTPNLSLGGRPNPVEGSLGPPPAPDVWLGGGVRQLEDDPGPPASHLGGRRPLTWGADGISRSSGTPNCSLGGQTTPYLGGRRPFEELRDPQLLTWGADDLSRSSGTPSFSLGGQPTPYLGGRRRLEELWDPRPLTWGADDLFWDPQVVPPRGTQGLVGHVWGIWGPPVSAKRPLSVWWGRPRPTRRCLDPQRLVWGAPWISVTPKDSWGTPWISRTPENSCGAPHRSPGPPRTRISCGAPHRSPGPPTPPVEIT
ncbi:PREDICTED: uncharacterized protein LOC104836864, partial [Haliaeetus leucocephalus]|uniref:uncharacterized protein LOC104836864 n=1 Tax=Haliaeetus leucocephalus TaxID=52644 RepID=UPI00053CAB13